MNIFQRLTRRWEAVHPYNAAQVLRIGGSISPSDASDAWAESLRALGLGRVFVLDRSRFCHEVLNGEYQRYPLRVLNPGESLEAHLTAELNRPFDKPDEPPFRPFLLRGDGEFHFGVVYQHWVADSVSIRTVLREWFTRLFDPHAARGVPLRTSPDGYLRLFGNRGDWRFDETLLANFRAHIRHRRVRKVQTHGRADYPVRVSIHPTPDGLIDRVRAFARANRVKVHDVLLAAVAEACSRFVPHQPRANRPDVSVGTIVDLRPHACADLSDTFGLFLGFTQVVLRPVVLQDWERLLHCVAAQNRVHKQAGLPQASMLWMAAAMAVNRWVPDKNLYHFYRKEMPTAGGLSNVNLNDSWAAQYCPDRLRGYLRVSPTGPLTPLVLSTTTLGSRLGIALTCRDALFPKEQGDAMVQMIGDRLAQIAL